MIPRRPAADEIAVGDQNPRRAVVGPKDSNRLAALNEKSLIIAEVRELARDGIEALPVASRLPRAAVDDEVLGPLGDFGVEVVHEHPERRFLLPALAGDRAPSRRADWSARLLDPERIGIELHSQVGHPRLPMSAKRISETAFMSAEMSPLSTRSRSSRGTIARTRSCAVRTPRPGSKGALKSIP